MLSAIMGKTKLILIISVLRQEIYSQESQVQYLQSIYSPDVQTP